MKHSLKKWLALLCAAALLLSVLTVTTLFTLAEEEWNVVRKASEYDGVSTYHQADSGIPQYDGVSGWRFSASAPYTGTVYFDAGTTVAAFKVTAILGHSEATSMLGFAVSADNSNWTTVTPAAAVESGGWPGCTYTCTPDAAFRYLRVDFLDTAYSYDPLLCNVYFKEQADDTAYGIVKKANEYLRVSTFQAADPSIPQYDGATGWRFSTGAKCLGTVVYNAGMSVTDFKVTAILGNSGATDMLAFEVSADKNTWTAVTPAAAAESGGWPGCTYTCTPDAAFQYLRITFRDSAYAYDPMLCNIYFKNDIGEAAPVYDVKKGPTKYSSISDDSKYSQSDLPAQEGVTPWRFSAGEETTGWVVFDAGKAADAFKAVTVIGSNLATSIDDFSFDISSDGSNWTAVTAQNSEVPAGAWPACEYTYVSESPFRYLRVNFVGSTYSWDPGLANVYFRTVTTDEPVTPDEPQKPDSYSVKKMATEGTAASDGTLTTNIAEHLPDAAIFYNDAAAAVPGTITYPSTSPITDYNFYTCVATDGYNFGGTVTFFASKDGEDWTELAPTLEKNELKSEAWGQAYYCNNFGTLSEDDGYYYLRVSLNNNGDFAKLPAFLYVEYNTGTAPLPDEPDPEKPTDFNNKVYPTEAKLIAEDGIKLFVEELDIANGYYTLHNTEGKNADGALIFSSKNPIESYNFAIVQDDAAWNGRWTFAASADGETWVDLTPTVLKGAKAATGGWGETYQVDNFGTLDKAAGYKYLRASVDANGNVVPFPSIGYVEFKADGPAAGVVEEKPDITDLDLPSAVTDFTKAYKNGVFKTINSVVSTNNAHVDYFGAENALVLTSDAPSGVIMYTPNVRDFKFVLSSTVMGDKLLVRAFGRTSQYGEETEIPLMRTGNIRPADKGEGTPWYQYRVDDRDNLAQNYEYIRIQVTGAIWTNVLNFTYFYDGPEPGDVPDDEQAEPEDTIGTEREDVKTINANKGNLSALAADNMGVVDNGSNAAYIGAKAGIVIYPDPSQDASAVFATEGISKFWVKFLLGSEEWSKNLVAKFYVAPSADAPESEWTEIKAHLADCPDTVKPGGWFAVEYVTDDDQTIPEGSNVLKVFIPAEANKSTAGEYIGTNCQIARIDYTFSVPTVEPLPEMATPAADKGEKEMLEDFSGTQLLEENGGKALEAEGLEWMLLNLGTDNGKDKVYFRESLDSDSYLIYHLDNITGIDIRGYRHADCTEDLLVYVSGDGKNWTALDKFTRAEAKLYGGPVSFAHRIAAEDIPAGMNYVKIEIPELAGDLTDLTISDIQVLYNVDRTAGGNPSGGDVKLPDTGVALPAAALLLTAISGAAVVLGRKRRVR